MRFQTTWVALALAAVTLAGCAEDGGSDDEDETFEGFDDLEATEDTGVIRGVVVDQAIVPIPGADVAIRDLGVNTTTTEEGAFGFGGLEPGTYILTASKVGFEETQASVDVVAGEDKPPVVNILLEPDPAAKPFVEMHHFQGFIACSFTLVLVSFAACGVDPVAGVVGNEFIDTVTYDRAPDFVQSEMVWDSTQTLGDSMSVSWTDPCHGAQRGINGSAGPSPQVVTWDKQTFEEMELQGCGLWLRVFSTSREGTDVVDEEVWNEPYRSTIYPAYNGTVPDSVKETFNETTHDVLGNNPLEDEDCLEWFVLFDACLGAGGVGVTIEQPFEIFTANFYNFHPDEGWMFVEDGPHPVPEP